MRRARRAGQAQSAPAAEAGHLPRIRYVLYAARIAYLLSEDVLLAPASASASHCPQVEALRRAVSQDRVRFLLAAEVGLASPSKPASSCCIEVRGFVRRTLVITQGPRQQWMAEIADALCE